MSLALPTDDRLLDLLSAAATEGLSAAEDLELRRLLLGCPGISVDELAPAAAAADLAFGRAGRRDPEPMPAELRERVLLAAVDHVPWRRGHGLRVRWAGRAGWLVAAAMAVVALWVALGGRAPRATLAERREALLREPDTLQAVWERPEDPVYAAVEGDVVWSGRLQLGFLRLRGLPANDPSRTQYQLWIVDPDRDSEPVDGGVFDVPAAAGQVIVAIDAKLHVSAPQLFAITVEQPGGVVVSEGPLRVVARVSG